MQTTFLVAMLALTLCPCCPEAAYVDWQGGDRPMRDGDREFCEDCGIDSLDETSISFMQTNLEKTSVDSIVEDSTTAIMDSATAKTQYVAATSFNLNGSTPMGSSTDEFVHEFATQHDSIPPIVHDSVPGDNNMEEFWTDGTLEPRRFSLYSPKGQDHWPIVIAKQPSSKAESSQPVHELLYFANELHYNLLFVYCRGPRVNATHPRDDPDDMTYVQEALNQTWRMIQYDLRRVYCIGLSSSGRFCSRVGSELSEVVAAIAPVSGVRFPFPNNATRPMPITATHATGDGVNPYAGGGSPYWQTSVPHAIFKGWSPFNGCTGEFETPALDNTAVRQVHTGCEADVQLFSIHGGDHGWPYTNNQILRVKWFKETWKFLYAHPLP